MRILKSLCAAFSVYSRIPVPSVKPDTRYTLCFLPLVGAVVGALLVLWFYICSLADVNRMCFAAVAAVLPLLVTGGIHADGYIDTSDALSSYGTKEKMLEILKDPHVGAFGIIAAIAYYILFFGFMTEISTYGGAVTAAVGFVLSRSLCALEIMLMRGAKNSGMLHSVSSDANKPATVCVSALLTAACATAAVMLGAWSGILVILCQSALVLYYKFFVAKKIGGITGDTCGYFIQMSELLTVIAAAAGGRLAPFLI